MYNNLPLEQWVADSFQNLTNAYNYAINFKYGSTEKAKLVAGKFYAIKYSKFRILK